MPIRINKYLAEAGVCSRRGADALVEEGRVLVNGKKPEMGQKVEEGDEVKVDGKEIILDQKPIYIMFNKPVGVITTTDESKHDNVISVLNLEERVFPVGRLDVASQGLLILTNDGELANRITHPKYEHEKEYVVELDKPISKDFVTMMATGVQLEEGTTKPTDVEQISGRKIRIILKEGRNRQIRRMCEKLGYEVRQLVRTRVMSLELGKLQRGDSRPLKQKEIFQLKKELGL